MNIVEVSTMAEAVDAVFGEERTTARLMVKGKAWLIRLDGTKVRFTPEQKGSIIQIPSGGGEVLEG